MRPVFTFFILCILYTKNSLGFRIVLGIAWTAVLLCTSYSCFSQVGSCQGGSHSVGLTDNGPSLAQELASDL